LISLCDIVSINEQAIILNIIDQCGVRHILTSPIKTITPVLKISTYIITSITAHPVELAAILVIMSLSRPSKLSIFYMDRG